MIHSLLNNYNFSLEYNTEANLSWSAFFPPIIELAQGAEYTVLINDKEYILIAQFAEEEGREIIFIGNPSLGAEIPFLLQYVYDIDSKTYSNFFYHNGDLTELSITITTDLEKANIILYNKKGKPVEYAGVETISTDTVISGAQVTFTRGEMVSPITADLDMREGDQIIHADGKMFKQVTISKPAELLPENIKKHVTIGGVEGTFAGDEVEKVAELDYSIDYALAYNDTDMSNFRTAENVGKYIRVMWVDTGFGDRYTYLGYYQCVASGSDYILQEVSASEIPIKDNLIIEADEDTVLTRVTLPRPETLKSENIRRNTDVGGITGSYIGDGYTYEEKKLAFVNGTMEITPTQLRLFDKVIVYQPNNLLAENIKKGITIAGVEGSYELEGLPSLYAPTAISNATNADSTSYPLTSGAEGQGVYISVTNPTSNGYFAKTCQLFALQNEQVKNEDGTTSTITKEIPVAVKSVTQGNSTIKFYAKDWIIDELSKTATLKAQFFGGNTFLPSSKFTSGNLAIDPNNDVLKAFGGIGITSMEYNLTNGGMQYTPEKVYYGQYITNTVMSNTGYLPKKIAIILEETSDGGLDYDLISKGYATYNNTTGAVTISYFRTGVMYFGPRLSITAECPTLPWLKDFSVKSLTPEKGIVTVPVPDSNVQRADVTLNGVLIQSANYPIADSIRDYTPTSYTNYGSGFSKESSTGFYKSGNTSNNSYSLMRVSFNFTKDTLIRITYINSGETTFDFGAISKVDVKLNTSYSTADSSSNCLFWGSGSNTHSTEQKSFEVIIPAGNHTMDFKYKKDGSVSSGLDCFKFKLQVRETGPQEFNLDLSDVSQLRAPGEYLLHLTGEAEGYTGTDPITITYVSEGATVDGEILNTAGTLEEETLLVNYAVVDDNTLICNVPNVEMDNDILVISGTVEEETITAEEMIINNETIIYGTPKEE